MEIAILRDDLMTDDATVFGELYQLEDPVRNGARVPIPVATSAVRCPWGEPTFAQPPGKGQMRRQRLLVAVPSESSSRPEARLRRLGRALR